MPRTATTEQVAAILHVRPATVRKYARRRLIPFDSTPGGHRRFDIEEVVAALAPERSEGALGQIASGPVREPDRDAPPVGHDVPYVRVEPQHSVSVTCDATVHEQPPVGVHDSDEERELWSVETPVV